MSSSEQSSGKAREIHYLRLMSSRWAAGTADCCSWKSNSERGIAGNSVSEQTPFTYFCGIALIVDRRNSV